MATAGFSLRGVNLIEAYLAIDTRALGPDYDAQPVNVLFDRLVSGCQQPKVGVEVLQLLVYAGLTNTGSAFG